MAWDKGFNFRATLAFVTDGANETDVLGAADSYPTTRNGVTFGWTGTTGLTTDNNNAALDRRLAGDNANNNAGTQSVFRVDLPATGQYVVRSGLGGTFSQAYLYLQMLDGATPVLTIDDSNGIVIHAPDVGLFDDATGTEYNETNWPGSNAPVTLTFSGTVLNVNLGPPTAQANSSTLAHLFISQVASAANALAWIKA